MKVLWELWKTCISLLRACWDYFILLMPYTKQGQEDSFAFLVHPRFIEDIYRPFPFFRYFPNPFIMRFVEWLPPITLARINGIYSVQTGKPMKGFLLSIALTPDHMKNRRTLPLVLKRVRQMARLAQKRGVYYIGLGAHLPSVTHYGKAFRNDISPTNEPPYFTTGHLNTAFTIVDYLNKFLDRRHRHAKHVIVAIVGAAGSTGSLCAKIIADQAINQEKNISLVLVDLPEKLKLIKNQAIEISKTSSPQINVFTTSELQHLIIADYIITVTNAPRAVIRPEYVRSKTVILDDSQPRATSVELLKKGVWVIDVLSHVPGLRCDFDFGFENQNPEITFTCLAETIMIAACGYRGDFSIGHADDSRLPELRRFIAQTRVKKAPLHSFGRELMKDEIRLIMDELQQTPTLAPLIHEEKIQ